MRTMKKSRENSFLLLTCLLERGMSVRVWKWKCERAESKIQPFHKTRIKWGPHAWKLIENKNQISKQRQTEKYFVCACAHPLQIDSGIRAIMAMCGVFIYTYAHMHRSRYSAQTGMQTNTHRCQPLPAYTCAITMCILWKSYFKLTARKFFCAPASMLVQFLSSHTHTWSHNIRWHPFILRTVINRCFDDINRCCQG